MPETIKLRPPMTSRFFHSATATELFAGALIPESSQAFDGVEKRMASVASSSSSSSSPC